MALGLGAVAAYLATSLIRSPYGGERIYRTGEVRDLYWTPPTGAPGSRSRVADVSTARPPFVFEKSDAPGLAALRQQILPVVNREHTDLQRAIAIRLWVREQADYGSGSPTRRGESLAADDILRESKAGKKVLCDRLAALLVTAYTAVELPARMVHLKPAGRAGHFVTEVWLPDQRRWVMMDPSGNYYAAIDGIPASVLELHRAALRGAVSGVELRRNGATTFPDPSGTPFNKNYRVLDYFRFFAVVNRNDFLTHRSSLDDYLLLVWEEGSGPAHPAPSEILWFWAKLSFMLVSALGCLGGVSPFRWRRRSRGMSSA